MLIDDLDVRIIDAAGEILYDLTIDLEPFSQMPPQLYRSSFALRSRHPHTNNSWLKWRSEPLSK
jgi:hypothetical protein